MSFAPNYTPLNSFADDEANQASGRSTVRTGPLDLEFDTLAVAHNALNTNVKLNQRDDGEIRDQRVKLHTLAPDVLKLLYASGTLRGAWVTATAYAVRDIVTQSGNTYIAGLAHTSGVFATDLAAGRWILLQLGAATGASGVPFSPTGTLAATNVQAAIDEADTEGRALSAAALAASTAETAARTAADTLIRTDLANAASASLGPSLMGYNPALAYSAGLGQFLNFLHARTASEINAGITPTNYAYPLGDPRRYGAAANCTGVFAAGVWGGTNDAAAVQAAVSALPEGGELLISRPYRISSTITVNKPINIRGSASGSPYNNAVKAGIYPDGSTKAFTLVARTQNYAFGQWGIIGVHFSDVYCPGGAQTSGFIATDTTVNGGDYHIRECSVTRCTWKGHATGIDFTGIAYLNQFSHNSAFSNIDALVINRGNASDNGGQTRFFGGFYGLNTNGIKLNTDTNAAGGDFGFHGVSISENTGIGLQFDEEAIVYTSPDCQFEANTTAGIYCEIKEANPNTTGIKEIGGKFITNGIDIWVNKTTTAFSGGGFYFPFRIDAAYLGSAVGLKVDVPGGHAPIDSPAFVLGRNLAGLSGAVSSSQISANFAGTDQSKGPYTKRIVIPTSYASGTVFAYLPAGLVVTSARMYFTANCSGFSSISLGDQANNARYLSGINGQTVTLNAWQTATITLPQLVIDSTNNQLRIVGTAGWLTAAAVVEIQGYVA